MLSTVPMLAFASSCFLDTQPLAEAVLDKDAGHVSPASAEPAEMLPEEATMLDAGRDSATSAAVSGVSMDAGSAVVTPPPPPTASSGTTDAGPGTNTKTSITASMADAGSTPAPGQSCDATGSYGLRAALDVTWEATPWFDVGRGTVELYGLVQLDKVDQQTQRASASFRLCGLSLPELTSTALCSRYQLQLPAAVWDAGKLPEHKLDGTYSCDAAQCSLQFSPLTYAMGITLADVAGPWPALQDTTPAQFADDDADGLPGVSVEVVPVATLPSEASVCTGPGAPTGQSNSGKGNPGKGKSGTQVPTTTASVPTLGWLQLGLRAQLTAALQLTPDCQLHETSASNAALDLRSGGCFVMQGSDPASASAACSEELRASFDQTLPHYDALEQGEVVPHVSAKPGKEPSAGSLLNAVRFEPGTPASCEQVRSVMF